MWRTSCAINNGVVVDYFRAVGMKLPRTIQVTERVGCLAFLFVCLFVFCWGFLLFFCWGVCFFIVQKTQSIQSTTRHSTIATRQNSFSDNFSLDLFLVANRRNIQTYREPAYVVKITF